LAQVLPQAPTESCPPTRQSLTCVSSLGQRMAEVVPSDIYPALRRFLLESGLTKSLRAFEKETSMGGSGEDDLGAARSSGRGKRMRALKELELTDACKLWLEARIAGTGAARATAPVENADGNVPVKKRKRTVVEDTEACEAQVNEVEEAPETERPREKKKRKTELEAVEPDESRVAEGVAQKPVVVEQKCQDTPDVDDAQRKKKKPKEDGAPKSGVPFKRVDDEKWRSTIADERLKDNTHLAKQKFGKSVGDCWADKASEDLLKVKGKGFRKEMAKKKRASWRGGGEIDMGVNSIKFADSSDDE